MCATCGCAGDGAVVRSHDHGSGHEHEHVILAGDARTVVLQRKVLAKNDDIAAQNRDWLAGRGIFMMNLMSAPGAGKTTLLERTGRDLAGRLTVGVIEGDQETALDAGRIKAAGCRVVQINTGAGCHLDAAMVARGLSALDPEPGSAVVVENVGNLVCPALFDLGEARRVVLASVTEGADKPLKYPQMFRAADLVVLTKVDLLPYVDFDRAAYESGLAGVSPSASLIAVSAVTGDGLAAWYDWLMATASAKLSAAVSWRRPRRPGRG
jgi:hydrogenase nickel incorporation protein HypB